MADISINNPSLAEYISQAQRGFLARTFGPEFLNKQTYFTVDTATGIFNTTYGKKVWHALNNQVRYFNAIPRVVWGNTAGWRVRTDRGNRRSRPITETGALPTVDISDIQTVSSLPRIVGTTFGASVKALFTTQLEGGVGDVLALETENAQLDHVKEMNEELLAGSGFLVSGGSAVTFVVPSSVAKHFKIGDSVSQYDSSATGDARFQRAGGSVVSAIVDSTGTVTIATGTAFADGDVAFIRNRAGFTSIDDVVEVDAETAGGIGNGQNRVNAYDLEYGNRTAGTWNAAARVDRNAGAGRDLTLQLLDNCMRDIRINGGEPKLILCNHDQYYNLERLLQSQQRYLGYEEYQVGVGNERTFPGTRGGMMLATYQGIPILVDVDVPRSVATDNSLLGSNIYVLDTDYIETAIAQPTQYMENRDYFAVNQLVVRGLLYTMGEQRVRNLWVHAKITDLNE